MARPDAQCVWHMHTLAGMAVSAQDDGLLPAHMYSHNFWQALGYHDFEGPSMRLGRARASGLEPRARTPGPDPPQPRPAHRRPTPSRRRSSASGGSNRACEIQLAAQSAQRAAPPPRKSASSRTRMGEEFLTDQAPLGELEFDALLRKIETQGRLLQELTDHDQSASKPSTTSSSSSPTSTARARRRRTSCSRRLSCAWACRSARATSSRRTSRACPPGTRCA